MIKIYRAEQYKDDLKLYKGIEFTGGIYMSDPNRGYGCIKSSNGRHGVDLATYEFHNLIPELFENIETQDGFLKNFMIWNPHNKESLKEYIEKYNIEETKEAYDNENLNDEAILLLTRNVSLKYDQANEKGITYLFGRWPGNAGYLLMPGAEFQMGIDSIYDKNIEYSDYEVLQSKGKGRQLFLTKLDR